MQVIDPPSDGKESRLDEVRWHGVADGPPDDALDGLTALAAEVCGVPVAFVSLVDGSRVRFKARVGLEVAERAGAGAFSEMVLEHAGLLEVPDVASDSRFPGLAGEAQTRFFAGVPLVTADGRSLGALGVMDRVPRSLSASQQKALRRLGGLVMLQLQTRLETLALVESERRLRTIIENEPECVKLLGPNCELMEMNPAGLRMIEADSMAQVAGQSVLDLILPEFRAAFSGLATEVMRGESGTLKFEIQGMKGTRRWLETHAAPLRNERGEIISLVGITRDISEWMRSQALLDGQREALELIASAAPLGVTLGALARFIEMQSPGLLCSVLVLDPDGSHLRHGAAPSLPEAFSRAIDGAVIGDQVGSCGTAAFRREPVFVADIASDPLWSDYRELALGHGLAACWSTPVFDEQQRVLGTFAIYYRVAGLPAAEHLHLIEIATHLAAIAIGRHREAEVLRQNHALIEAVMEGATDMIFLKDLEGRYQFVNSAGARLAGRPLAEIIGRRDDELFPEEMARHFRETDEAVMATGEARTAEETGIFNGQPRFFSASKVPWRDAAGRMVGIIGVTRDITRRRHAEAELLASETNYRTLVESASDAILVSDIQGRLLEVNAAGCRMFGYSREEMLGMSNAEIIVAQDVCRLEPELARLKAGEVVCSAWQNRRKDGSQFPSEASATVLPDGRILALVRDVSERKMLEQQLLRAQRLECIGTLAGGIAHDLNNALGPILMSLDLLRMKFPDHGSHELLGIIGGSAQRCADMVRQVLTFARGVDGRREDVSVRDLLHEMEKIANDTFLKSIAVKSVVPADLWFVVGDPTQLHQVLVNLCVNARDAMPNGGRLDLTAENQVLGAQHAGMNFGMNPGPHILIRVEDNGTGMPRRVVESIFDPFFTTKEIGKGTGLGLSTTLAIVKSHGGFIQVCSEEGKGTTFHVYLPARPDSVAVAAEPAAEAARGQGTLVLVVDDEILVGQITRQTLEAFGYRVLLAADGADAVAVYTRHHGEIAAVITDMMMPVMDGPATIQALKKINPAVRIIATSGLSSAGHLEQVARLGVTSFLPKPYTAQSLLKVLKEEIARKP